MPALIEGHTPEPRIDENVGNRRPHLTPLTACMQQKDSRPGANLLTTENCVGPSDTPRDNHVGPPYLVPSRYLRTLACQGKLVHVPPPRVRRPPDEARRLILDTAAKLLAEGGVAAVQVRAIATRVGMTDAGVNHHFGTRDRLLEALLRHGGHKIQAGLNDLLASWLNRSADLADLINTLATFYRQGYSELAVALHAAGWRDEGSGMLDPIVDALHALRPNAADIPIEDTRLAVAALHHALATEPLYGPAFRRSAGLTGQAATEPTRQLDWWTTHLTHTLGLQQHNHP
jgi:AcrR family transcriptional regulator